MVPTSTVTSHRRRRKFGGDKIMTSSSEKTQRTVTVPQITVIVRIILCTALGGRTPMGRPRCRARALSLRRPSGPTRAVRCRSCEYEAGRLVVCLAMTGRDVQPVRGQEETWPAPT